MPTFKHISLVTLNNWKMILKSLCDDIVKTPNKFLFGYLIVNLYEYFQCYCYLTYNNLSDAENVKITLKDIKKMLKDDKALSAVASTFMTSRNNISHGYLSVTVLNEIYKLISDKDFILLLQTVNLDTDLLNKLNFTFNKIIAWTNTSYEANCLNDCKKYLEVQSDGASEYTIAETAKLLTDNYDETTANKSIVSVLGNLCNAGII